MIVAETPRLILRQLTLDDVNDLAAIHADPVVMRFFGSTYTCESTKQWLEERVFNATSNENGACGRQYIK